MEKEGGIDRFNKEEQKSLRKYENYIDLETANYTDARNVGAEWLCKQTIDKLQLEGFPAQKRLDGECNTHGFVSIDCPYGICSF
ncbi:hypothetical protein ABVC73_02540 [Prevotella melaninogenica]